MKNFSVIKGRLAVFHIKYQAKHHGSILYRHRQDDFTLSGAQWVWVYRAGPKCKYPFKPGDKILVEDGLVMTDSLPNTWELCRELPEFKELKELEEKLEATIQCKIMFETAALAIDDNLYNIESQQAIQV